MEGNSGMFWWQLSTNIVFLQWIFVFITLLAVGNGNLNPPQQTLRDQFFTSASLFRYLELSGDFQVFIHGFHEQIDWRLSSFCKFSGFRKRHPVDGFLLPFS